MKPTSPMLRKLFFAAIFLVAGSSTLQAQITLSDSIYHNNLWRKFLVFVPAGLPANGAPLILNLHGMGSNAQQQQFYSNFAPIADTAKFLMVYPQGIYNAQLNTTYWNAGFPITAATGTDDVGFLSALIDTMQARYRTDPNRTYSTGMSMGGYMSDYLACNIPVKIAAVASVTGSIVPGVQNNCRPPMRIPNLHIHGTADPTVPYNGNANGLPIDSIAAHWRRVNNCAPTPFVTNIPDINAADNCTAIQYVWKDNNSNASVELYKIINGEHTWPGAPISIGRTNQDISASKEIWRFFRQYRKSDFLAVKTLPKKDSRIVLFPNPATNRIVVEGQDMLRIDVYDATGQLLGTYAGNEMNISHLAKGIYLLKATTKEGISVQQFVKE